MILLTFFGALCLWNEANEKDVAVLYQLMSDCYCKIVRRVTGILNRGIWGSQSQPVERSGAEILFTCFRLVSKPRISVRTDSTSHEIVIDLRRRVFVLDRLRSVLSRSISHYVC